MTQPRVSELMRGKIHLFFLDTLMDMASTAGMTPEVTISKLRNKRMVSRAGRVTFSEVLAA